MQETGTLFENNVSKKGCCREVRTFAESWDIFNIFSDDVLVK